jgi:hypothetical protein
MQQIILGVWTTALALIQGSHGVAVRTSEPNDGWDVVGACGSQHFFGNSGRFDFGVFASNGDPEGESGSLLRSGDPHQAQAMGAPGRPGERSDLGRLCLGMGARTRTALTPTALENRFGSHSNSRGRAALVVGARRLLVRQPL